MKIGKPFDNNLLAESFKLKNQYYQTSCSIDVRSSQQPKHNLVSKDNKSEH